MMDKLEGLVRPIIGIENRTAQEAFDIMADRIRSHFATPTNGEQVERVIAAVVEEAEQACRYLGKHNSGNEQSDYNDGFLAACDILGTSTTIHDHVERHKDRILATLATPHQHGAGNGGKGYE